MALSTREDSWSTSSGGNLTNETGCKLPWVDFVEETETSVDVVILICLLLTLLFNIFLVGIILLHDDLRKKARIILDKRF